MHSLTRSYRSARAGFTIIELLVACSVTALLVGIMFAIISSILSGWNRSSGTLETGNQARLILDSLGQDIQASIMRRDSNVWFAATIQTAGGAAGATGETWTGGTVKPADASSLVIPAVVGGIASSIDEYRFGQAGVWLRFFTNVPDKNDGELKNLSAPRAVSYQIIRRPVTTGSSEIRYQFYRAMVRPGHDTPATAIRSTFGQGYDLFGNNGYNNPSDGANGGTADSDAGNIRRPYVSSQLIGNNVVDFGVRVYTKDSTGAETLVWPLTTASLGFAATIDTTKTPPSWTGGTIVRGYPSSVEVMVRVLTSEGVRMLEAFEGGKLNRPAEYSTDAEYWWGLVVANSQIYTRRIEVKSTSL